MPTVTDVRDGPASRTARVKRSCEQPGPSTPARRKGQVPARSISPAATNGSVTSKAATIVRTAPASASGSRASANLSATVIEPKSAADTSASTTASTIQRYNDYDPPPWTIRAYASWPS